MIDAAALKMRVLGALMFGRFSEHEIAKMIGADDLRAVLDALEFDKLVECVVAPTVKEHPQHMRNVDRLRFYKLTPAGVTHYKRERVQELLGDADVLP